MITMIIAFNYNDDLYGIINDILNIYNFSKKINKESQIYVLSDICSTLLNELDITFFSIENKEQIIEIIKLFISKKSKYLIYYTGHGKNNSFLVPNKDIINVNSIIDLIKDNTKKDSEIILIIDCCQIENVNLPFLYKNGKFTYNSDVNIITQYFLCIVSHNSENKTLSTIDGSLFTISLIKSLQYTNIIQKSLDITSDLCLQYFISTGNAYSSSPIVEFPEWFRKV